MNRNEIAKSLSRCAIRAGKEIQSIRRSSIERSYKHGRELVTSADRASHDVFDSMLKEYFHGVPLVMEEQENSSYVPTQCVVVDELDGTIVFASGGIDWGVTCAYIENSEPVAATIYLPERDIVVVASQEGGTWLNGERVQFAECVPINEAIFLSEINSWMNESDFAKVFALSRKVLGVRVLASATASVVDLLLGRGHIYLNQRGGKIWDFAAGALAIQEAGGVVVGMDNTEVNWNSLRIGVLMARAKSLLNELEQDIFLAK